MDYAYNVEGNDLWLDFLNFPSNLFADEPKLEVLEGVPHEPTFSMWDASSWEDPPFLGTFSSTGSTESTEDLHPVLLPAADFVFQTSEGQTQTLVERVAPKPISEVVTTGQPTAAAAAAAPSQQTSPLTYEAVMKLLCKEEIPKTEAAGHVDEEIKKGKRKMPDVDLDSISDPEEKKRQKRMAKNRRTAAVSRLRKKARLDNLENQIDSLQNENQKLKSLLSHLLSQGVHLASPIDELAMLMTVIIILATVQSMVVLDAILPMTPHQLIKVGSLRHLKSPVRFTEHFTVHSPCLWLRMGVT